jgi:hypothetical protein
MSFLRQRFEVITVISHWKRSLGAALAAVALVGVASAQFNFDPYKDPDNEDPVAGGSNATNPYSFAGANPFLTTIIGIAGSFTYGPQPFGAYPFGDPDHDIPGAIAFATIGGSGLNPFDDGVALTGALFTNVNINNPPFFGQLPFAPSNRYGYASLRVVTDGTTTDARIGEDTAYSVTPTANFRSMTLGSAVEDVNVSCKVDLVGASIRFDWVLTNNGTAASQIGFRFAHGTIMRHPLDGVPGPAKIPMVLTDRGRNLLLQNQWFRGASTDFPEFMDFFFAQSEPYPSMRFRMLADDTHPDATPVDRVAIGSGLDSVYDFTPIPVFHSAGLMMYWNPTIVAPGASRRIVYYIELGNMKNEPTLPYAVNTEVNPLIRYDENGQNQLTPNPFQVVGYADNQYARFNQQVTLEDVEVTITLPEHLSLAPGEQMTKSTGPIPPNQVAQVQFQVVADGIEPGIYPYTLTFDPTGPSTAPTRSITHVVIVGLTPTIDLRSGPNLITIPWSLASNTFNGNGLGGFAAYDWDPVTQSYVVTTTIKRGFGQWLLAGGNPPPHTLPNASSFGDETTGQFRQVTKRRWNLLGNPYPFAVKISQLIGVSATDPMESFTWEELVNRGYIRPYIFTYNSDSGSYEVHQGEKYIQPGKGFWMYNASVNDLDIIWPSVLLPGLPGSGLLQNGPQMQPGEWGVDLSIRGAAGSDLNNRFGVANNVFNAGQLGIAEPPKRPNQAPQLYFASGEGLQMEPMTNIFKARSFVNRYTAVANVAPGQYTLSWKVTKGAPANANIRLKDMTTGRTFDMGVSRTYSFTTKQAESRRFEITVTNH